MTVPASKEEENLPTEPKEQTANHHSTYQTGRKCLLCPYSRQADTKHGNYLSLILSIINTFHSHSVLFFLVTTPCSSPHLLHVLFCAFPQLSRVCFLVLFLGRRAHRHFWIIFYNLQISLYIAKYFERKQDHGHYHGGVREGSFLCMSAASEKQ